MRVYGRGKTPGQRRARRWRPLWFALLALLVVVPVVGANAYFARDEVAPGIVVQGVDIGGLTYEQARLKLRDELGARLDEPMQITAKGQSFTVVPSGLGIGFDGATSVRRALKKDRLRAALFPFGNHRELPVVLRVPARASLPAALRDLEQPPVDAALQLDSQGVATVTPAEDGVGFVRLPTLAAIARAALAGQSELALSTAPIDAEVTTAEAERARERVERMISAPIRVRRGNSGAVTLQSAEIGPLLTAKAYGGQIGVSFDPERVQSLFAPLLEGFLRLPVNAGFQADEDGLAEITGSRAGIAFDANATARRLTEAGLKAAAAARVAKLNFRVTLPEWTTKEVRALGITNRVSSFTSDMGYSTENRIHNVGLLARYLDGTVVQPGETFSFNDTVGPRTEERGFLEGQAIENGLLVPSIGGGVCQVATTVFNAAFAGGYPVVRRINHSFYISHYPMGLDATVADGGPDFQFRNDTEHALYIAASSTNTTMTVSFFSAPLHRSVKYETGAQTEFVEPKNHYVLDESLPEGTIQPETTGERGFDVSVTYQVIDDDGEPIGEPGRFVSSYDPQDVYYKVGKGAKLPKGATLEPPREPATST